MFNIKAPPKTKAPGQRGRWKSQLHQQNYSNHILLSRGKIPKIILGQALLFGDRENAEFWPAFESLLRAAV